MVASKENSDKPNQSKRAPLQ